MNATDLLLIFFLGLAASMSVWIVHDNRDGQIVPPEEPRLIAYYCENESQFTRQGLTVQRYDDVFTSPFGRMAYEHALKHCESWVRNDCVWEPAYPGQPLRKDLPTCTGGKP